MSELNCTKCGKNFPEDSPAFRCDCGEPLEFSLDLERKPSISLSCSNMLENFSELLPPLIDARSLSMREGITPLTSFGPSRESSDFELYLKNESFNPTWSFKDRGTYLSALDALNRGYARFGTVSTGNMAASVAAYGSRAGLDTLILVSKSIPSEKLAPIAIYGPRILRVEGDYGDLFYRSLELGPSRGVYFSNSDVPMRVEGSKTIAFEIYLQLNEKVPDYVIVPTSSGGNIRGIEKGFRELKQAGICERVPTMVAVQAMGCSPIYSSFEKGSETVERFAEPNTLAHAIENPLPPSGNAALRMLKRNGGVVLAAEETEILQAQRRLAQMGIFIQPASATPIVALKKLRDLVPLKKSIVVAVLTGSGLKYQSVLEKQPSRIEDVSLASLEDLV